MNCRVCIALSLLAVAFTNAATAGETDRILLVGKDMSAWRKPLGDWQNVGKAKTDRTNPRRLVTAPGNGVLVNTPMGGTRHLFSSFEHGDIEAHIEFMIPKGSNSGIYFHGRYEIQICDSWDAKKMQANSCGGIYQRWQDGRGFEGSVPSTNVSRPPGEWQTFDVIFRAPRFDAKKKIANARFEKVVHNGVAIHPPDVELSGPTRSAPCFQDERPVAPLMLQGDHGPVAFRNIWIRPLKASQNP